MVVGERRAGLTVYFIANLPGFPQQLLDYTEWCENKTQPESDNSVAANSLLMREVRGE